MLFRPLVHKTHISHLLLWYVLWILVDYTTRHREYPAASKEALPYLGLAFQLCFPAMVYRHQIRVVLKKTLSILVSSLLNTCIQYILFVVHHYQIIHLCCKPWYAIRTDAGMILATMWCPVLLKWLMPMSAIECIVPPPENTKQTRTHYRDIIRELSVDKYNSHSCDNKIMKKHCCSLLVSVKTHGSGGIEVRTIWHAFC